jgi:hypothetical protein
VSTDVGKWKREVSTEDESMIISIGSFFLVILESHMVLNIIC